MQLRVLQIILEVPRNHRQLHILKPVTLNAILVEEPVLSTDGSPPILWLLLTSLGIDVLYRLLEGAQLTAKT